MKVRQLVGLATLLGSPFVLPHVTFAQVAAPPPSDATSEAPAGTQPITPTEAALPPTAAPTGENRPKPAPAKGNAAKGLSANSTGGGVQEIVVTGRFIATGAGSATKLNTRVLDTPFSVAAYTEQFLDAIETNNVADTYRYMTGVQRAGNTGYDLTLRGFKTSANDRNAILTDGLPGLGVRFGSPPTVGTDHIELVKGPASVLYGQAQPGGFINIITKKPKPTRLNEIEVKGNAGIGEASRSVGGLISLDSTGAIDAEDRFLYRFVGETGKLNEFRRFSYEEPIFLAPSLTWNLSAATSATVAIEYRKIRTHYDTYLVAPQKDIRFVAPIDTNYQEPNDYLLEEGLTTNFFITHRITQGFKFNLGYRYVDHSDFAQGFDVVAVVPANNFAEVSRRARRQDNKRTYNFGDANITGEFNTGPFSHKMVVGLSLGRETSDLNRLQFFNGPATGAQSLNINILNPVYGRVQGISFYPLVNSTTPGNLNDRFTTSDSFGAYFSDLVTLTEHFKVMFGLRYAKEDQEITELKVAGVPKQNASSDDILPLAGLLYQPTRHLSFYASYATSFVPVAASTQDINGLYSFTPTTADSIEFGVKTELFDGRLSATAAQFTIKKQNVVNTFACPLGTCGEQVGAEEASGFEAELNATPLSHWQITAGYAYTDGKVTKSDIPAQIDARLTNSALHAAHLWTRYDIADGPLKGLGFGLGISYNGERTGLLPTAASSATLLLPAYTVVDLGVYYALTKGVDITLKIQNVTDERYYESAGFTGDINIVPGTPRLATLAIKARF